MDYTQPSIKVTAAQDDNGLVVGSYQNTVRSEDEVLGNEYDSWEEEEEEEF